MAKFLTIAALVLAFAFAAPASGKTDAAGSEDSGIIPCTILQKYRAKIDQGSIRDKLDHLDLRRRHRLRLLYRHGAAKETPYAWDLC